MLKPKVSIIMGVYNCEQTLSYSINSILNQLYDNWELIICDDCSTDASYNIAYQYMQKYPDKIKLIKNEKNLTLGPTLNKCLELVTGDYIARQDADDTSLPERLERQIDYMLNHPEIDLVGTGMKIFDENGVYGRRILKENPLGKDLMTGSVFAHATILCKKDVYIGLGGYSEDPDRQGVEDYELWFRFFNMGYKGYNLSELLYEVREDRDAYLRKNYRRRINEIKTMKKGRKIIKLPYYYNLFTIKPFLTILIPNRLLKLYHKIKFQ